MFEGGGCVRADRDTGAQTRDRGQVATATAGKADVLLLLLLLMMLGCFKGPGVRLVINYSRSKTYALFNE